VNRLVLLLVAASSLAFGGCAAGNPAPPPALSLPPIEITRTGGFAGVHETLSITSDGHWSGSAGTGQLDAAARTRLSSIVVDPAFLAQIAAAKPDRCCDMFQYELRVGDQTYVFGEPDLGPLLTELLALLSDETGF
jgi:hypothetical protein